MNWPAGARAAGVSCGIKRSGARDLGLLVLDRPTTWAGTFTTNAAAAAPVLWSRSSLGRPVRALVVNSGNANACTGASGMRAVEATGESVAGTLGCEPSEVLVASTGPIGVPLPVEKICAAIPTAAQQLTDAVDPFAHAILTTDTCVKTASVPLRDATVTGVAKGAAMLAPNMATMLAFIVTDAVVDGQRLQGAVAGAVDRTFNRICVDGCESTNDSVFVFATGTAREPDPGHFDAALTEVCRRLAEQMVQDAEGASRFVRIRVSGAADEATGVSLGRAVASSALWRAALHGGDPNWGRVLSALGSVDRSLDMSAVEVAIGEEVVFASGEPAGSRERAAAAMSGEAIAVTCRVGDAPSEVEVLTTDLSPEYVLENAVGTS